MHGIEICFATAAHALQWQKLEQKASIISQSPLYWQGGGDNLYLFKRLGGVSPKVAIIRP